MPILLLPTFLDASVHTFYIPHVLYTHVFI